MSSRCSVPSVAFEEREERLRAWFSCAHNAAVLKHVRLLPSETVASPSDVDAAHARMVEHGYEGVMLRDPRAGYK